MTRNFKVVISNSFDSLAAENVSATIEAEYGDRCVEGKVVTLAHHGPRSENPCPCVAEMGSDIRDKMDIAGWTIGVSHLDLDTIGGIARIVGMDSLTSPTNGDFWEAAAYVDCNGPHRLESYIADLHLPAGEMAAIKDQLHAYWAWAQSNRVFAPRDGSVADATEQVSEALWVIGQIFAGDPELMEAGRAWAASEVKLNADSLAGYRVAGKRRVLIRIADRFCNHLYATADGLVADVVIALNSKFKSITVSRESDSVSLNCREFVQSVWGMEAGGHDGIAGSPRGREMTSADLIDAAEKLREVLT